MEHKISLDIFGLILRSQVYRNMYFYTLDVGSFSLSRIDRHEVVFFYAQWLSLLFLFLVWFDCDIWEISKK